MDTLDSLRNVYSKEAVVRDEFKRVLEVWKRFIYANNGVMPLAEDLDKAVYYMGSLADGASSARWFSEKSFLFEGDFLVEIAELPENVVSPIKGKPGFYQVKNDGRFQEYLMAPAKVFLKDIDPFLFNLFLSTNTTQGTLNLGSVLGSSWKLLVEKIARLDDGKRDVTSIFQKVFPNKRVKCDMNTEYNGPATTQLLEIKVNYEDFMSLSFDVVVGGKLSFWPQDAQSWPSRSRKWPSAEVVEEIIRDHNVHLVAKPSLDVSRDADKEWRLTFMAEKRIIAEQSKEMKFTYYLFKILFHSNFKKEVEGKTLPSYIAKTTMFWMCEELEEKEWTEENTNKNLKRLFSKLLEYLDNNFVPNYFVPSINLLGNTPAELLETVKKQDFTELINDPMRCLPVPDVHMDVLEKMDVTL